MGPTIVLVHGAFHGAWCWEGVVDRLAATTREVVAVDLPGHGDDPGPFVDLHGDAERVRAVLDEVDGDVLLVGHSYGGAVVTEAGVHPAVQRVVYVAAFCIDEDESCAVALGDDPEAQAIDHDGRPDLAAGVVFGDDGTATLKPDTAAACFYQDCDEPTTAWALSRLGPQPVPNFMQSPAAFAWKQKPTTYVVCTEDQGVHPELQDLMARRCNEVERWAYGHSPFLADPDHVAVRLHAIAG